MEKRSTHGFAFSAKLHLFLLFEQMSSVLFVFALQTQTVTLIEEHHVLSLFPAGVSTLESDLPHARAVALLWVWVEPTSQLLPEGNTPRPHQTDNQKALQPPAVRQLQGMIDTSVAVEWEARAARRIVTFVISSPVCRWTAAGSLQRRHATSFLSLWTALWKLWGSSPQPGPASWRCLG